MSKLPTYFISHGGGPWPYMPDFRAKMRILEASLVDMTRQLGHKPKAVLMISGHWEESVYTVMSSPTPPMVYDYYGFPPHTYEVKYQAPGDPVLAERVRQLITDAGLPAALDPERGFDHGTFAPLVVMYPDADVPVVQLSMRSHYDPMEHVKLGRALAPLRDEDVLIIGSGLRYHNLRMFGPQGKEASELFDRWLADAMALTSAEQRTATVCDWAKAPAARIAHPREDHLIPLMVALGAAESEPATRVYHEENIFGGITASSYRFG